METVVNQIYIAHKIIYEMFASVESKVLLYHRRHWAVKRRPSSDAVKRLHLCSGVSSDVGELVARRCLFRAASAPAFENLDALPSLRPKRGLRFPPQK